MTEFVEGPPIEELRVAYAEAALSPSGVLHGIALSVLEWPVENLTASEAAAVIRPPRQPDEEVKPRWVRVESASKALKAAATASEDAVYALAGQLDMRKENSLPPEDLARIDPEAAIWVVEGGGKLTSVVRRGLALAAMQEVYGPDMPTFKRLYQLGSGRKIPRLLKGQPNPEYEVAQRIARDYLPKDDSLTEYGLSIASALQDGFEDAGGSTLPGAGEMHGLKKPGSPDLVVIKPEVVVGGLYDGLTAARYIAGTRANGRPGGQFVIATNGQYRAKDELQARRWAVEHPRFTMVPSVALGDEQGFSVEHDGQMFTTALRPAITYVDEAVTLFRR